MGTNGHFSACLSRLRCSRSARLLLAHDRLGERATARKYFLQRERGRDDAAGIRIGRVAPAGASNRTLRSPSSIIRGGTTVVQRHRRKVARGSRRYRRWAIVVTLESPVGTRSGSIVYDGLPSIDPTVCVGLHELLRREHVRLHGRRRSSTRRVAEARPLRAFTGGIRPARRSAGENAVGHDLRRHLPPPAGARRDRRRDRVAQNASRRRSDLHVHQRNDRPVGACPAPPPPPPPPPALQGVIVKLVHSTIHKLLNSA